MKTRNIREVKVGGAEIKRKTIIELKNMAFSLNEEAITPMEQNRQIGRIRKVLLATLEYIEDLYEPSEEYKDTFQQNVEVVVDDSKEVEFTRQELKDMKRIVGVELARLVSEPDYIANSNDSLTAYVRICMNIIDKLNKMLKECR
jgi:hypothetical protein